MDVVTVTQAAELLGVARRTVLDRIQRGDIKATKIGDGLTSAWVITAEELARFVNSDEEVASS